MPCDECNKLIDPESHSCGVCCLHFLALASILGLTIAGAVTGIVAVDTENGTAAAVKEAMPTVYGCFGGALGALTAHAAAFYKCRDKDDRKATNFFNLYIFFAVLVVLCGIGAIGSCTIKGEDWAKTVLTILSFVAMAGFTTLACYSSTRSAHSEENAEYRRFRAYQDDNSLKGRFPRYKDYITHLQEEQEEERRKLENTVVLDAKDTAKPANGGTVPPGGTRVDAVSRRTTPVSPLVLDAAGSTPRVNDGDSSDSSDEIDHPVKKMVDSYTLQHLWKNSNSTNTSKPTSVRRRLIQVETNFTKLLLLPLVAVTVLAFAVQVLECLDRLRDQSRTKRNPSDYRV